MGWFTKKEKNIEELQSERQKLKQQYDILSEKRKAKEEISSLKKNIYEESHPKTYKTIDYIKTGARKSLGAVKSYAKYQRTKLNEPQRQRQLGPAWANKPPSFTGDSTTELTKGLPKIKNISSSLIRR